MEETERPMAGMVMAETAIIRHQLVVTKKRSIVCRVDWKRKEYSGSRTNTRFFAQIARVGSDIAKVVWFARYVDSLSVEVSV